MVFYRILCWLCGYLRDKGALERHINDHGIIFLICTMACMMMSTV